MRQDISYLFRLNELFYKIITKTLQSVGLSINQKNNREVQPLITERFNNVVWMSGSQEPAPEAEHSDCTEQAWQYNSIESSSRIHEQCFFKCWQRPSTHAQQNLKKRLIHIDAVVQSSTTAGRCCLTFLFVQHKLTSTAADDALLKGDLTIFSVGYQKCFSEIVTMSSKEKTK